MASNEKEVSNRLLKVMSTLYCQSISADFRKPVEILYPNIALDYLSIIKHPMDLGTLLLECMKGTATVKGIRDGLKQVFMNSIRFNVGAPMMEATSRHLESFATGLFEETMKIPFNEKVSLTEDFSAVLVRKRNLRLLAVCRIPLREKEIKSIEASLQRVQDSVPRELLAAVDSIKSAIQDFFLLFESEIDDTSTPPVLTIESIFSNLLEVSRLPFTAPPSNTDNRSNRVILPALAGLLTSSPSDGQIGAPQLGPSVVARVDNTRNCVAMDIDGDNLLSSPQTFVASERLRVKANSKVALLPSTLSYLNALDSCLGILLVQLEERLLRGTGHSSVWQRPYGLVWAQPAESPWWPAMVVASSSSMSVPPPPAEIAASNLSRIPALISKQLMKMKAKFISNEVKYPTTTLTLLTVPEKYMLVEFFGTHDFGWLREDSTVPMTLDGVLSVPEGTIGCSASGVRNAISTLKWLENEDSKYMSHSLRQRHLQSKMKMVDDWKQSRNMEGVKGPDGGGDGDRGSGVDPGSADSTSLTGLVKERDEESKAENLDSENSNSNIMSAVEDEEDDEEILDQDDLHCTPSLSELTADICPYKDKHGHGVSALREDKTDDIRTTSGKDVEKEKDFTSPPKKKGRWPEKDKDSSSPKNQKDVAKKINLKGKGNLDSEFQTKAGLRAEEGDYSGLLVNGLFASSVLRTGSYYKAKDKAIVKAMYFTRWIEMVHPVPGGPTFPEQKKRGHKKNQDSLAESDPIKVEAVAPIVKKKMPIEKIVDVKTVSVSEESKKREISPEKVRVIKRRRRRRSADAPLLPLLPKEITKAAKKLSAAAAAALISGDAAIEKEEEWCAVDSNDGVMSASASNAQGPYCTLTGGCTLHIAGEGAIQTRHVDFAAPLFQKESKFRECRKEILREELRRLTESFNDLRRCAEERCDLTGTKRPSLAVKKRNKVEEVRQEIPEPVHDPTPQVPVEARIPGMPIRKSPLNRSPPTFTKAPATGPPKFHAGNAAQRLPLKNSKIVRSSSSGSRGSGNGSVLGGTARARAEEETSSECSDRERDGDGDRNGDRDEDTADMRSMDVVGEREGAESEKGRGRVKGRSNNYNRETDDEAETEVKDRSFDRISSNDETDDDFNNLNFSVNEEQNLTSNRGEGNSNSNADLETEDERDSEEYGDQGEVETEEERDDGGDGGDIEEEEEEESEGEGGRYERDDSRETHSSFTDEIGTEMTAQADEEYGDESILVEEESLDVAFKSRNYNDQIYRVGGLDAVNVEEDDDEEGEEDGEGEGEGGERYDEESVAACGFSTEDEDEDDNSSPESDGSEKF